MDELSYKYQFCPGKATWYAEVAELFEMCLMSMRTGILPKDGSFLDQDELFVEVFPFFVQRWNERAYYRVWSDVRSYVTDTANSIMGKG